VQDVVLLHCEPGALLFGDRGCVAGFFRVAFHAFLFLLVVRLSWLPRLLLRVRVSRELQAGGGGQVRIMRLSVLCRMVQFSFSLEGLQPEA